MMQSYFNPVKGSNIAFYKNGGATMKKKTTRKCACGCAPTITKRGGKLIEECNCKK